MSVWLRRLLKLLYLLKLMLGTAIIANQLAVAGYMSSSLVKIQTTKSATASAATPLIAVKTPYDIDYGFVLAAAKCGHFEAIQEFAKPEKLSGEERAEIVMGAVSRARHYVQQAIRQHHLQVVDMFISEFGTKWSECGLAAVATNQLSFIASIISRLESNVEILALIAASGSAELLLKAYLETSKLPMIERSVMMVAAKTHCSDALAFIKNPITTDGGNVLLRDSKT